MLVVLSREPLSALAKSPHYTYVSSSIELAFLCGTQYRSSRLTPTVFFFPLHSYQKPISRSKKRPRSVLPEEATAFEALPLTSTPLPGQGTAQRGQLQPLPNPSQAGAAPRATKSAANDSADRAVTAAKAVSGDGEGEAVTEKKKKPSRRRTRRKMLRQTETAGEGATPGGGQAAETSEQRMDISA